MVHTAHELAQRRCQPLKGAEHALSVGEVQEMLSVLPGWALSDDGKTISRDFRCRDFHRTMALVNAIAWIAHAEDHHPDLVIGYGRCTVRYHTHDVGGLSLNDFICAARADALYP